MDWCRHRSIVDVMTITTNTPSIFERTWPSFAYQDTQDPDDAHRIIGQAHRQAPIALGPYGPEVLDYDLVRTVLRDSRFAMPRGISLVVQGITSGPVWDKVCQTIMSVDAGQHQRLRRLVSRAFTPRAAERMRTACTDAINELVDRHSAVGRCDMVHDIARQYPVPIICALVGAPSEDWELFARWADDLSKAFGCNVAAEESAILRAWEELDAYLET
jgi:cytochrome P450